MGPRPLPRWLFRTARPATAGWNLAKTFVQVVVVWSFALGLLPWLALSAEGALGVPRWTWSGQVPAGVLLFVLGSTLGLSSAWAMATRGHGTPVPFDAASSLVLVGPYRVVRNPMAVGAIVQMAGVAVAVGSAGVALLALGGALVWHLGIRPSEERFLVQQFGEGYEQYRSAVRCWWPRWPPYPKVG